MTAFASNILAGLTGLGAKTGAGTTDAKGDGGVAGAFEALLAGLVANGQAGLDIAAATNVEAAPPVQPASPMPAVVASTFAPALVSNEAPAADVLVADVPEDVAPADATLAGAEALVLPLPFAAEPTAAAPAGEDLVVASSIAVVPVADAVEAAFVAPDASEGGDLAIAPARAEAPQPAAAPEPRVDGPLLRALIADPVGPAKSVRDRVSKVEHVPVDSSPETAARAPAEAAPAASASQAAMAPVADAADPVALAARAAAPELVSLVARLVEPAKASSADAAPTTPFDAEGEAVAAETLAEPVEAVAVEAIAVEAIAVEVVAEAPVEVAAETAVPTAAVETPQPARKSARAEAVRAADKIETLDTGLKAVAGAGKTAPTEAADTVETQPAVATPPVAEAAQPADAPTREAPAAAQGAAPQAHAVAADASAVVRGSPETVAKLASDIARKLEGQSTRFDIQLDPLGLGKVDVSIEINADGRLTAALTFDSAQAAADLRGRATELRQALEKAGFDLTDASLSFDTGAQSGGFGGREPGEQFAAWSSRAFRSVQAGLEQADAQLAAATYARTPSGGVDIRI